MVKAKEPGIIHFENLDPGFCNEVASLPGGENIRKCFACGTCSAGCPVTTIDEEYNPRKIIRQILFGMREEVLKSPVIWFCMMCYRCYARCPQQVNFTDVMRAIRYLAIKNKAVPADILSNNDEIDRLSQLIRRDMVKHTIEGRKQVIKEIKSKIDNVMESNH
ncbi:MAG: 4Fe-4S dicluster domain-containing protein [Candidatus Latescibacteria bacterium]|nr:4Fe-4S dicluster domain-containing protein [Candidatus Latescibacterota bacterium]